MTIVVRRSLDKQGQPFEKAREHFQETIQWGGLGNVLIVESLTMTVSTVLIIKEGWAEEE